MGQLQHTNNVRRVDFAKAAPKSSRNRSGEAEARVRPSEPADRGHLKVVPLPGTGRRRHRRAVQNMQTLAIAVMAALLGVFVAAVLLDPAL